MRHRALSTATLVLLAGCQCKPVIPDDPDKNEDTAKEDTAAPEHTGDTGPDTPPGPCSIFEVEPNDAPSESMPLPLETYLCGGFATGLDFDHYEVVLPQDGWLGVYVDAALRGSFADVISTITSDVGVTAGREDDDDIRDTHLVFPALAGTYTVLVSDENFNGGGDEYFYEMVATVAKDPFLGNKAEIEPNDTSGVAMAVVGGDRVEGLFDPLGDQDWYKIAVPAGQHVVTVDVDGFALGSPGDPTLSAYEEGLAELPNVVSGGLAGSGADPYWEFESDGNETLWFRVEELASGGGSAWWYGLVISVEAS